MNKSSKNLDTNPTTGKLFSLFPVKNKPIAVSFTVHIPLFIFEGESGKMTMPLLRPGRRNKSVDIYKILRRIIHRPGRRVRWQEAT